MERYRILKKLAEGGSGETFLVWDKRLECEWVMKCIFLCQGKECREESLKVAEREIRALKQLRGEGIPFLADAFYEEAKVCLVMEYMQGISLEEKIKRDGAMSEQEAVSCGLQIAKLLSRMHHLNGKLVHGDLKPLNLIWNNGRVSLLDFGMAVFSYGMDKQERGIFFTPGYGAPELTGGGRATVKSDIYAFGAVLYYLLTGKASGSGHRSYKVREENGELSKKMEQIILKCTKAVPEERYHSIEEVEYALQLLKNEEGTWCQRFWQNLNGERRKNRKCFKTTQNILLTDGKRFPFVLNCSERDKFYK